MKLLLCITLLAASATASAVQTPEEADSRFAFINWEDNQVRFDFNSTSIAYGVVTVIVVALLVLVLIPLLTGLGGGGEETGYSSHSSASAYDPYSSYKRSLEAAVPIVDKLHQVWDKLQ